MSSHLELPVTDPREGGGEKPSACFQQEERALSDCQGKSSIILNVNCSCAAGKCWGCCCHTSDLLFSLKTYIQRQIRPSHGDSHTTLWQHEMHRPYSAFLILMQAHVVEPFCCSFFACWYFSTKYSSFQNAVTTAICSSCQPQPKSHQKCLLNASSHLTGFFY